jgi:hypothetical protein
MSTQRMFKLPIEYRSTYSIAAPMMQDLELTSTVDPSCCPMYHCLFKPTTELAKKTCDQWAHFTDDVEYLQEFPKFAASLAVVPTPQDAFYTQWNGHRDTKDFCALHHYVEYERVKFVNNSPKFLFGMSVYSMTAPVMFLLSPIIILVIPFLLLKIRNIPVNWAQYRIILSDVLKNHALGAIFSGFGSNMSANQKMYFLVTAGLFGVQLYSNVMTCYQFYGNMNKAAAVLQNTAAYLDAVLPVMKEIAVTPFQTMARFAGDVGRHYVVLGALADRLKEVQGWSLRQFSKIGVVRQLFYQLKFDKEIGESMAYSFGVQGFSENMANFKKLLVLKKVNACKFGAETKFRKAHYPPHPTHRKNSHAVENLIVTGPNASGKTTLIKTAMLNVLFSQQVGAGFYRSATIAPYQQLCCYMNIPDTSGRDSLFQAEARRCKGILDSLDKGRMLCIFDELFSGTNPYEATASTYAFLTYLKTHPECTFMLTTHFVHVCDKVGVPNYHMKTKQTGEKMEYSYKLVPGISKIKGALHVLKDLDFPKTLIEAAKTYEQ